MELTIPTPVTDARSEFSSLVFASNLSPTPPAAVTVNIQQAQDQYWIRTPPAVIVTASPESVQYWIRTPPAVIVTASPESVQYWIRTPPAVIVTASPESVQYWIRPVEETTYNVLLSQLCC